MRKSLFTTAAAISGLMAVGVFGWWIRSRGHIDVLKIGQVTLAAKDGGLAIQYPTVAFHHYRWLDWQTIPYDMKNDPMPVELRPPMFGYSRSMELKDGWQRTLIFPLWLAAIVFAILPAVWVKRRMGRKSAETISDQT
jgi:hypothetical protein